MTNYRNEGIRYEFKRNTETKVNKEPPTFDEKAKKSLKTMDIILVIVGIMVVAFTITMIILYVKTGGIPDTLVGCFFGICGGECGVMGLIKHTKDKYLKHDMRKDNKEKGIPEDPSDDEFIED